MITIGGNVCVRNGLELDYCFREAILSLLPVCDSVTVCDGESTDGTLEVLRGMANRHSKIKVITYPWPRPSGDIDFWVKWLNYARERVTEDYHLQLDADEVLSERAWPIIEHYKRSINKGERMALLFERRNFWKDAHHLAPNGVLCGNHVIRFGPSDMWLPSDAPHRNGDPIMAIAREPINMMEIMHYGFLRRREAFFEKAKTLRGYFFSTQPASLEDSRIAAVRDKPGNWMEKIEGIEWTNKLIPYSGGHPPVMIQWLKDRGHL